MQPKLILLVGIPGAGKTTYAQDYIKYRERNTVHLSSDAIRKELYGDEAIQGDPNEVFALMQKRAVEFLNHGIDVIYDATSLTRKSRRSIIQQCPAGVEIDCRILWAPIDVCIERDSKRERSVGRQVIDRMLKRFQVPYYDEGINKLSIIRPQDFRQSTYTIQALSNMRIPHDNPHHTLDISDHCDEAVVHALMRGYPPIVQRAARYHDVGKPYVKSFTNAKGEATDIAHYYQHQNVGAYMACGITDNFSVIWLVNTHMDPYLDTKYYRQLPPYLRKMVDQLHDCDKAAH